MRINMKAETLTEIKETFKNTVRVEVAKGGHVRWGEKESVAVIEALKKVAPVGPALFPEDELTDQSMRTIVGELIQEKLFYLQPVFV